MRVMPTCFVASMADMLPQEAPGTTMVAAGEWEDKENVYLLHLSCHTLGHA